MTTLWGRSNIGWYLALPCLALTWYYLSRVVVTPFPYGEGLTALLSAGTFLPLMLGAIGSAWEGGRLAGDSVGIPSSVRPPFLVATVSVLPTVTVITVSHFAVITGILLSHDVWPPFPAPHLYAGFLSLLFGLSILAWVAGYFLTSIIAAPLMAVLIYLLAISPSLLQQPEYRALVADRSGCCGIDEQVDSLAIATPILVGIGFTVFGVSLAAWRWNRGGTWRVLTLAGISTLALSLILPGLMDDPWATIPRNDAALHCEMSPSSGIEYCVWPEQAPSLETMIVIGDKGLHTWANGGILPMPDRVTTQSPKRAPEGTVGIAFPPRAATGDIILGLAVAILPDPARCQGPAPADFDYSQLLVWLMLEAGVVIDDPALQQFTSPTGGGPVDAVVQRRSESASDARAWFDRNLELLRTCQVMTEG